MKNPPYQILLILPPSVSTFKVDNSGEVRINEFWSKDTSHGHKGLSDTKPEDSYKKRVDLSDSDMEGGGTIIPALGPLYLASVLRNNGFEVDFIDFDVERYSTKRMLKLVAGKDAVGITLLTPCRPAATKIINDIRSHNKTIPIVTGGPDVTLCEELIDGVDVAVMGDATSRIVEIFQRLIRGEDLSRLPGLILRNPETGQRYFTEKKIFQENLDDLPLPARQIVNAQKYPHYKNGKGEIKPVITSIITSRGCPFHCRFCSIPDLMNARYQERSVESVLDELENIYENGFRMVYITDDTFTVNKRRAHRIMDGIIERKIRLMFMVCSRVDAVDSDLLQKMRRAGVRMILFGLESGNQEVLDYYKKKTTVELNRKAVEAAHKTGLYVLGWFIIGAPIEATKHIRRTIQFALDLPLTIALFRPLFYVCGTPLWKQANENGNLRNDEIVSVADKRRNLGILSGEEYIRQCIRGSQLFFKRPKHIVRMVFKVIRFGDFRFAYWYFRIMYFSQMRKKLIFVGNTGK